MIKKLLIIQLLLLGFLLNAQTNVFIEVLPAKEPGYFNYGIKASIFTDDRGSELDRNIRGDIYHKWNIKVYVDNKYEYSKTILPEDFRRSNSKYRANVEIINTRNISGSRVYFKVEKIEGIYNENPFGGFEGIQQGFNLELVKDTYESDLDFWRSDFRDADGDGVADHYDRCKDVPGLIDNKGCPKDSDGDGVADNLDNCPTIVGDVNNNGCPFEDQKKVEIIPLSKSDLNSDCYVPVGGCAVSGHHISNDGSTMDFRITVQNKGSKKSIKTYAHVYLRPAAGSADDAVIYKLSDFKRIPQLNPNGTAIYFFNFSYFGSNFQNGSDLPVGAYDLEITIQDGTSSDSSILHKVSIPFRVKSSTNGSSIIIVGDPDKKGDKDDLDDGSGDNILIQLRDIKGNEILRTKLQNKADEIEIIKQLSKGLYIIKDNKGNTRKILKK